MSITRSQALAWWTALSFEGKWWMLVKHKAIIAGYPNRDVDTLTGREIEGLFLLEKPTVKNN